MRALTLVVVTASASAQIDTDLLAGLAARPIGPAGMSGRVAVVEAFAADPDLVWVGAATGGAWKSDNGGLTWTPMFDDQPVQSVGALAIDPNNRDVVWVGTGEGNVRNSTSVGNGVYRTRDGGRTWQHLGLETGERVHRILLDPRDADHAFVAVLGPLWGPGEQRGVYETRDGGGTWARVLYVNEGTGCADLAMDPRNPDHLLAAMWQHRRWPWGFQSGGPGSGLHVTWDGGRSWRRLNHKDGLPKGELGRIGVAFARSQPETVYALVEAEKSALVRSDDGGMTFRSVNADHDVAPRPFYYADIRVDPQRPDRVYSLHSLVSVSDDGGRSFRTLVRFQDVHPDHHAMWIDPEDGSHLWLGNDGGIAESRDRGASWRFAGNLPLAQLYHVDVDMDRPYHVYFGLQDNGSWRGPSDVWENGGIRNHHWQEVCFGDGFRTLPDPEESRRGYAMSQQGFLVGWDLRTGERRSLRPAPRSADEKLRFHWNAGLARDPFEPATVYFGSQLVHRSRDRGLTWDVISGDLTTNDADKQEQDQSGGLTLDVTGAENHTTILCIAPSPKQQGVIWVGTDDGRLHVTRDGGQRWTSVEANLPGVPADTWIPHVEPDRFDAAGAFVVLDDHRRSNQQPYLLHTADFGATWRSLVTDDIAGYCLRVAQDPVDRALLFLGTEHGLWFSTDGGGGWQRFTHGIPRGVGVRALAIHPREHDLVIGTHGRGVFVIDDISPLRGLTANRMRAGLTLFPPRPAVQHRVAQTGGERFPGAGEYRGATLPYGALLTVLVNDDKLPHPDAETERVREPAPAAAGDDEAGKDTDGKADRVRIEVRDERGELIRTFHRRVKQGFNRLSWDLRRKGWKRPRADDDDDERGGRDRDEEPAGPEVLPGSYSVTVHYRDQQSTQPVEVLPDPRGDGGRDARLANLAALERAGRLQESLADAIERIGKVRDDLAAAESRLPKAEEGTDDAEVREQLTANVDALREALQAIERRIWTPPKTKGIPAREHALGAVGLASGAIGSTWDKPTAAALRYLELGEQQVAAVLADLERELGALAEVRELLGRLGVSLVR